MGERDTCNVEPHTRNGGGNTLLVLMTVGIVLLGAIGFWLAYINAPVTF